jgi:uncharacterized protein
MLAALCTIDLRLPACQSLKEKRHVIKSLTSGLRSKFNVSVAEVDHQELWQRATLAVSTVAGERYHIRKVMHEVEKFVSRDPAVDIIDTFMTLHAQDD